jgi:uncharacterized protein DUF1905
VATVDGHQWTTSVWRDAKNDRSVLAIPARVRGEKGHGDRVTVQLTFDPED